MAEETPKQTTPEQETTAPTGKKKKEKGKTAAGRGFGEAAALLYTTGSGTDLRWNNWNLTSPTCPLNIFRPAETLSLQIWGLQINGQDPNLANLSAAILMILVLLFSIGANALSRHINKKNSGN